MSSKPSGKFKIPNREVMSDWASWITGEVEDATGVLNICVRGPVNTFAAQWPDFMQQNLDPKAVVKARGALSSKTPERIYQVFLLGLMYCLQSKGWEISIEPRGGSGYIDIFLVSKGTKSAVLIELKSSNKEEDIEKDSLAALDQMKKKNYRNPYGLLGIRSLREYGIANYHLQSCVNGRYMELDGQGGWVQKDDTAMKTSV